MHEGGTRSSPVSLSLARFVYIPLIIQNDNDDKWFGVSADSVWKRRVNIPRGGRSRGITEPRMQTRGVSCVFGRLGINVISAVDEERLTRSSKRGEETTCDVLARSL